VFLSLETGSDKETELTTVRPRLHREHMHMWRGEEADVVKEEDERT